MSDDLILPLAAAAGFVVLIIVGLAVEALSARRRGERPMVVRHRPRFVQTIIKATIIRRKRDSDETRGGHRNELTDGGTGERGGVSPPSNDIPSSRQAAPRWVRSERHRFRRGLRGSARSLLVSRSKYA